MASAVRVHMLDQQTLALPRILCLHGGGSNARIFRAQCRVLRSELKHHFRLVFAEAPFNSEPGPDVTAVYQEFGPFRRWLRSADHHEYIDPTTTVEMIEDAMYSAMDEDDLKGATGDWVAVMGFSQGAKVAASLLFRQQVRAEKLGRYDAGTNFRFAVLMAGRGPLVSFDPQLLMNSALVDASEIGLLEVPRAADLRRKQHMLQLPTIHLHGLSDPGLAMHQTLLKEYCTREARLAEWDGAHRVPIRTADVRTLVKPMLDVARETGVLV